MSKTIHFSLENLEKLFPFYFEIDRSLNIHRAGRSLEKVTGEIKGSEFLDVLSFVRPHISIKPKFDSFIEHQNMVVILQLINVPLVLKMRGQFLYIEDSDTILYLGSPWITDVSELDYLGLSITDFAIHDTISDNLQLLKSKEIVNDDMKRVAQELMQQRNQLAEKNKLIEEIAKFPDQNPEPILRISFDNKLIYSNKAARQDFDVDEFLKYLEESEFRDQFLKGSVNRVEHQYQWNSRLFLATFVYFKNNYYFNVYLRDITEQYIFQKELLLANSRLETLFSSMQTALIAEDAERKIILVNQDFCNLFEISGDPASLKGVDCSGAAENSKYLFIDEEGFVGRIDRILEEGKAVHGDQLIMKDGRILERDYIPIFKDNQYQGQIWRYQDITHILETKESLRRVEDKYKKIIEDLEFGLIEVDLEHRITKVYPAFCQLTGYNEEELIGVLATDLLAISEDLDIINRENQFRKEGRSGVYEARIRTKNNELKWVIISGAPIYNWKNEVVGSIGIHLDITERKRLEEDLLNANEEAKASVKARQLFLANMSHEIRTPLNVIIGMSEVLNNSDIDEDKAKLTRSISISAINLLNLVNDVLDFSKIDAGYFELENRPVSVKEIVSDLYLQFESQFLAKELEFNLQIDPNISEFHSIDGPKLIQVLTNLISNAMKFTEEGSVKLEVSVRSDSDKEQLLFFSVNDTGVGVSDEKKDQIFDSFVQEDASVSRKYGGTGLGLSIARSIVQLMGGEIHLESQQGIGSKFSFEIKLEKYTSQSKISEVESFQSEKIADLKVLVAEDNSMNQLLIKTILEKEGAVFKLVNNGLELLNALENSQFDMILMDIQMPLMDGLTTVLELRKRGYHGPVIALTANVQKEEKEKYLKSGFNAVITKPFRRNDLIETMITFSEKPTIKNDEEILPESFSAEQILELVDGDKEFLKEMLETFLTNISNVIQEFINAKALNDSSLIKYNCHQIKPSLQLLNFKVSYQIASEIENRIGIGASVNEIEQDLIKLIHLLEKAIVQVNYDLKNNL